MLALILASITFDFWGRWICWFITFILILTFIVPEGLEELRSGISSKSVRFVRMFLSMLFFAAFIVNYRLPAPINCRSEIMPTRYAIGAGIGGVRFLPEWTDFRAEIENPTDQDYEDAEFTISSDMEINGIGQISSIPEVRFVGQPYRGEFIQRDKEGNVIQAVPAYVPTFESKVRLHVFPKKSTLELVLALSRSNPVVNGKSPEHQYADHKRPCWVKLRGSYSAWKRTRTFEEQLDQFDLPIEKEYQAAAVYDELACSEGTIMLKVREIVNGVLNTVIIDNAGKRFVFDPVSRNVLFRAQLEGRSIFLTQSFSDTKEGRHVLVITWSPSGARLGVDGVVKEDWNNDDLAFYGP